MSNTPQPVADVLFKMMVTRGQDKVMVRNYMGKPRLLRVYGDEGGSYVRTGKRGTSKNYIRSFEVVCDDPFLAVFNI